MTLLFTLLLGISMMLLLLAVYVKRSLDMGAVCAVAFLGIFLYLLLFVPVRQYECGNPCPVGYERGIDNLLP